MLRPSTKSLPSTIRKPLQCELDLKWSLITHRYPDIVQCMYIGFNFTWIALFWSHCDHYLDLSVLHEPTGHSSECEAQLEMKPHLVRGRSGQWSVVDLVQPSGDQADHDQNKFDHIRKTRQRDHQCHCGKNFQVQRIKMFWKCFKDAHITFFSSHGVWRTTWKVSMKGRMFVALAATRCLSTPSTWRSI